MSLVAAYLLTRSQSPTDCGWIATFALVPWLAATRASGRIESIGLGVATGVTFGAVGSSWIFSAFEAQGAAGLSSVFATMLTVFWAKGLIFGVVGGAARTVRSAPPVVQILVVASLIGLGEFWMSHSRWGLPVGLLGHSQISVPGVAQLAILGGVPILSALLIAMNDSIALAIDEKRQAGRVAATLAAAWLTLAAFGIPLSVWLRPDSARQASSFLLVQPETPRDQRWAPAFQNVILDRIAAQTSKALETAAAPPDAILWPENLLTTPLSRDKRLERQLQDYVDQWGIPLITGLVRASESGRDREYRNTVVWLSPETGALDSADKVRAMPLVESNRDFVGRSLLVRLIGGSSRGPRVDEAEIARPLVGDFTLAPALCFELLFPKIVFDRRGEDSVAIVNLADDSWVPGEAADRQLIAAGAFRAIEQRMTLLRISHGGLSVVIDPFGREIGSLPPNVFADMTVEAKRQAPVTILERVSVWALAIAPGATTWLLFPIFSTSPKRESTSSLRRPR